MLHKTIATIAASITLFTSTGAFAHAAIVNSSIANGGGVATTPVKFNVTFSAPVRLAGVTLTNGAGAQVPMTYRGGATPTANFSVPLPRLAPGTYTMAFRAMGTDGHPMAPQTTFTIGAQAARSASQTPAMAGMDHSKMAGMKGMSHGSGSAMTVTTSIADAELRQFRSTLAAEIIKTLDSERLSVREAEKRTGFSAADFSRIRQVKLERFTVDRLMRILDKLNRDVHVSVSVGPRAMGAPTYHHTA